MTDHEMRIRLVEAMGYHRCKKYRGSPSAPWMGPDGAYVSTIPNPLESDADAAALEVWCVTTRPWCAGLTIVVDARSVEVCVDTYEGDPDAESVVVHRDTEPDPRRRRRLALCRAICHALDDPEAEVAHQEDHDCDAVVRANMRDTPGCKRCAESSYRDGQEAMLYAVKKVCAELMGGYEDWRGLAEYGSDYWRAEGCLMAMDGLVRKLPTVGEKK